MLPGAIPASVSGITTPTYWYLRVILDSSFLFILQVLLVTSPMNFAFRISLDYYYFSLISIFIHQYYCSNPSTAFSVSNKAPSQFSLSLVLLKHPSDHTRLLFTILQWLPVVSKFLMFWLSMFLI